MSNYNENYPWFPEDMSGKSKYKPKQLVYRKSLRCWGEIVHVKKSAINSGQIAYCVLYQSPYDVAIYHSEEELEEAHFIDNPLLETLRTWKK